MTSTSFLLRVPEKGRNSSFRHSRRTFFNKPFTHANTPNLWREKKEVENLLKTERNLWVHPPSKTDSFPRHPLGRIDLGHDSDHRFSLVIKSSGVCTTHKPKPFIKGFPCTSVINIGRKFFVCRLHVGRNPLFTVYISSGSSHPFLINNISLRLTKLGNKTETHPPIYSFPPPKFLFYFVFTTYLW